MKALIALFTLAMLATATAQPNPLAQAGQITNKKGENIGTVTQTGNHFYLRDLKGEHFATIVIERDGTRTLYDPSGKVLDKVAGWPSTPR